MAALLEGQQYGLSAQDKINCNKSLVFVKLTDSALRSIEEYVKYKGDNLTKPTIEFQHSNGIITLPRNGSSQSYGFTLSNVEADGPQGSFECLRQIGNRSLESIGCMLMKMHVNANEDSYEKTRVKMAAAEQEHKKFCTKEIKPNGPHLGRKVKVKRPGLLVSSVKMPSPPNPTSSSSTINTSTTNKTAFKTVNEVPVKKQQEPPKFLKNDSKRKYANTPELLRQPIRDRIIHILALRPYKRPELLVRLMSEGLREKDKKGITAILTQVGTPKGNVYTLANYLWNEVQENWKFCTQEELEIIRKRKQQFFNSSNENEVPNSISQSSSPIQKCVLPEPEGEEPRIKKQRISHYNRTENTNSSGKIESSENGASDKIQPPTLANGHKIPYSPPIKLNGKSVPDKSSQRSCSTSPHSSSDSRDSLEYNGSSNFQVPPPEESPPSDYVCPEYIKEYGTIESRDQRAQYKADFNAQYEEYLRLHSKIKSISRRFAALEHHLHTFEEGSEEFKRIKGKIYKEYRAYQQDRNYAEALKQFNFLHCKLSHIKRLVMEYDNAQCVKS